MNTTPRKWILKFSPRCRSTEIFVRLPSKNMAVQWKNLSVFLGFFFSKFKLWAWREDVTAEAPSCYMIVAAWISTPLNYAVQRFSLQRLVNVNISFCRFMSMTNKTCSVWSTVERTKRFSKAAFPPAQNLYYLAVFFFFFAAAAAALWLAGRGVRDTKG